MTRFPPKKIVAVCRVLLLVAAAACGGQGSGTPADVRGPADLGRVVPGADAGDAAPALDTAPGDAGPPADAAVVARPFVVITFNTGTTEGVARPGATEGYTPAHAAVSDEWYGDGLAWTPAVEAARAWFALQDADVVVFQEIFWTGECPSIPPEARRDFVCERWSPGDPTVAQAVLGEGWQVACHPGKPDKCAAVSRAFGVFRGCADDLCLEGLEGFRVEGCGSGARVARGVIERTDGGTLTLVSVHSSSGMSAQDQACRVRQVEQVFLDLGAGGPGVSGAPNLVMGDFNTDPGRLADADPSAGRWTDFVGDGHDFHFVTAVGWDAPGSYAGFLDIDHVVSDTFDGACRIAGLTEGHPAVLEEPYFDHRPVVCQVR